MQMSYRHGLTQPARTMHPREGPFLMRPSRPNHPTAPSASAAAQRLLLAGLIVCAGGFSACSWFDRTRTTSATSKAPTKADAATTIAKADEARQAGNTDEAIRLLAEAIEKNPTLTVAHMEIGDLYLEKGNPSEAERHFAQVVQREPSNFDANYKQGLALQLMNRLSDAVRAYLRALSIHPDDPQANFNLATAYLQLNEGSFALPYAEKAVQVNPSSGPAHANLGAVYASLDRQEDAVREYRSAAELMDLTPQLLTNLGDSLGKLGRYQEMASTLEQAVKTAPSASAYERLGYARFKLRQWDESQADFRKSIALDSNYYPALNGLAVCLLNQFITSNKTDEAARVEAVNLLRRSLKINRSQNKILDLIQRYQ